MWSRTLEILDPCKAIMESCKEKRKTESEKPWKRSNKMDAREFWKIVEHECARVGSMCIRGCKFHAYYDNHEFCLVKPNTSHKDPVAIAEEIKVKRDKPKPAKQFEPGKRYRFSAKLFWENVENKYLFESIVIKNWVNKCDGEDIDKLEYKDTAIKPEWCYEVPAEKPELPSKILVDTENIWKYDTEAILSRLVRNQTAIIDYLKARENND